MLSVLGQTYGRMEYIIIDGGSTDGTQEIIERVRRETEGAEKRIVWYASEPDKGIYDAMNKGLAHASGDWVNFMNAGDAFADDQVLEDIFGEKPFGKADLSCVSEQLDLTCQSNLSESSYSIQTAINAEVKVIAGHTINVFAEHEEMQPVGWVGQLEKDIPFTHQAAFTRLDPTDPWRFDLMYRLSADYNLFHSIYKHHGAQAFLMLDRTIARFDRTASTSYSNFRTAKKEYLCIQSAWTKAWWWNEWKRLWCGVYK